MPRLFRTTPVSPIRRSLLHHAGPLYAMPAPPPLQFAKENSRTLRKDLRDLRLLQPPDIASLEAAVQNFSLNSLLYYLFCILIVILCDLFVKLFFHLIHNLLIALFAIYIMDFIRIFHQIVKLP